MPHRSNGVHAANYVVHVPRTERGIGQVTCCGRLTLNVNCVSRDQAQSDLEAVCNACKRSKDFPK